MLLLLLGCAYGTRCERVVTEVADDDPLGDLPLTVGELVTDLDGVRRFPASSTEGAPFTATLELLRGEAAAVFTDTTWVTDRTQLEVTLYNDQIAMFCTDILQVPLDLSFTTEDGAFAIEGAAVAESLDRDDATDGTGVVTVTQEVDLDDATLPAGTRAPARVDMYFEDGHLEQLAVSGGEGDLLLHPPVSP